MPTPPIVAMDISCGDIFEGKAPVFLDINFSESKIDKWLHSFEVSLSKGELALTISGGEIPLREMQMIKPLEESVLKQRKEVHENGSTDAAESDGTISFGIKGGTTPSIEGGGAAKAGSRSEETKKSSIEDNYGIRDFQVRAEGAGPNPRWVFTSKDGTTQLLGGMLDKHLGNIVDIAEKCKLCGHFSYHRRYLHLTPLSGVFANKTQHKLMKMLIANELGKTLAQCEVVVNE